MNKKFIFQQLTFLSLFFYSIMNSINLQAQACSGSPNPGSTIASSMNPCPGLVDTFSIQNYSSLGSGITYQWNNSSGLIAGATNSTYNLVIIGGTSSTLWCDVTCTASGMTVGSIPVTVTAAAWGSFTCYCTSKASATQDEEIYNVTLNGGSTNPLYSLSNGCTTVAPGPGSILKEYSSFLSLPPLATLNIGAANSFTIVQDDCDGAPYYANKIGIWIDLNHNFSFNDPGEQIFIETVAAAGPRTITGTFVLPPAVLTGNTVMRIVCSETIGSATAPTPCGIYFYGETEDYLVNIIPSPPICTGVPNLGNTMASSTTICGAGSCNLSLQFPPPTSSLYSLQWYNSSGAIPGATNSTYSFPVTVTDWYYCKVTCISSGANSSSNLVTVHYGLSNAGSSSHTVCDSYVWNSASYTASGIYIATFTNTAGCDSVHTLNLTINQSNSSNLTQTDCDFYLFNGTMYTTSGNYTQTFTNAAGCDSIVHLSLTINLSTDSLISAVSCNLFTLNGQTYTNTGTFTQNYTNAIGCDSIVTLQVSIDTLNATITINGITISTPNIGTYQWIDCNTNTAIPGATNLNFIPAAGGTYAVVVTSATCVDTSICVNMWMTGIEHSNLTEGNFIYPNPNQGVFEIELKSDAQLMMLNDIGETILQQSYKKGKRTIDISNYANGIYFLKIKREDITETVKLTKE